MKFRVGSFAVLSSRADRWPHVVDRRAVGANVRDGELHVALEVACQDAVEPPCAARCRDMQLKVRPLAGQLIGRDHELLLGGGCEATEDDADGGVSDDGEEREPEHLLSQHAIQHECGRKHRHDGGETNAYE
jgi:hypothetical protein